jgi:phosphoglycolate phosphatase
MTPSAARDDTGRVTLALFDLDGTLVDGQHSVIATFEAVFPAFGYRAPAPADVRAIIGRSLPQAIGDLLGPSAPAERMAEAYKAHFHVMRARPGYSEAVYPHVDPVLRRLALRRGVLLGTATGKALRGIRWMIEANDWHGLFDTLQAADTAASKPAPDMVLNACRETGVPPARTIVFGDSVFDMQMAVAAGAHAVGVSWGYASPDDLTAAGAHRIIDSFLDVEAAIDSFQGALSHA